MTTWDYTKMSARRKGLVRCPKCGKIGQLTLYTPPKGSPSGIVKHKGHVELGMFNMVDESCNLSYQDTIDAGYRNGDAK